MNATVRLIIVGAVLAAVASIALLAGKGSGPKPGGIGFTPTSNPTIIPTAQCLAKQKAVATPSWYPKDLPLPPGTVAFEVPTGAPNTRRVIFDAKGSLRDFVVYVLREWPKHGYTLGKGDAEAGEAEDTFADKTRAHFGAFRAREILCEAGHTWVLIVMADRVVPITPSPSARPLKP